MLPLPISPSHGAEKNFYMTPKKKLLPSGLFMSATQLKYFRMTEACNRDSDMEEEASSSSSSSKKKHRKGGGWMGSALGVILFLVVLWWLWMWLKKSRDNNSSSSNNNSSNNGEGITVTNPDGTVITNTCPQARPGAWQRFKEVIGVAPRQQQQGNMGGGAGAALVQRQVANNRCGADRGFDFDGLNGAGDLRGNMYAFPSAPHPDSGFIDSCGARRQQQQQSRELPAWFD